MVLNQAVIYHLSKNFYRKMKLIRKKFPEKIDLPFEVGQTYLTKMATGEFFTIESISKSKLSEAMTIYGFYSRHPDLHNCPISPNRLIPKSETTGEMVEECFCPHCKEEIII
jgi:hypothetical protein